MNFSSWFNYGSLNMYRHKFKKYLSNIHTPFIIICSILPHWFSLCLTFVLNRLNIYFISTLLCLNMCLQITKAFPDNHFPTYSVSWQWLPIDLVMFLVLFGTASLTVYLSQATFKLLILLPQCLECWEYKLPSIIVFSSFCYFYFKWYWILNKALCMLPTPTSSFLHDIHWHFSVKRIPSLIFLGVFFLTNVNYVRLHF